MMVLSKASRRVPVLLVSLVLPMAGAAQDAKPSPAASPAVAAVTTAGPWVRTRESRVPPLRRPVTLRLNDAPLRSALEAIARAAGVTVAYGEDVLRSKARVTRQLEGTTLVDALALILEGTGLDAFVSLRGDALLVRSVVAGRPGPTGTVVGRVTDAKSGGGIATAEVLLDGVHRRTTTDSAGRFRLADVDTGTYAIVVRRFGYSHQRRTVVVREGQTDTVDMALEPMATRLNELVSTATGNQRRLQVPNDITLLNADSIVRTQPVTNVTQILEGRVPGLTVQHTSGAPGDPSRLRLRGAASPLLNNDPIVIVDGVRVYAQQSAARSTNLADYSANTGAQAHIEPTNYATPSPLDYIDPNTIETIEVVKGPSAATLYGQDAANGAIVITTKKGHAGPTRWTLGAEHGVTAMLNSYPERTVRWGHLIYSDVNVLCPIDEGAGSASARCAPDSLVHFQLLNDPNLTVFDHGQRTAANLGVSGGTQALTYNVTGSYSHTLGLLQLPGYEIDRYTARLGQAPPDWMRRPQQLTQWGVTSTLGTRLGEKADLSFRTSLTRTDQQRSPLENQLSNLDATYFDRTSGIYYTSTQSGGIFLLQAGEHALDNYYTKVTASATQLTTGLSLNWRPWAWLTTDATAGLDVQQRTDGLYLPRNVAPSEDSIGRLSDGQGRTLTSTVHLGARATRPLGRGFTLQVATGTDYTATSIADVAAQSTNLPVGQQIPGTDLLTPLRRQQDLSTFGWYVEPSIVHPRFAVNLGLRLDGGTSYGRSVSGFHLPSFPKLGFSYLLSEESWFPFKSLVQSFRVRASYGRASRQPGPTDRLRLYTTPDQVWVDGQFVTGTELKTLGNTELRPERSAEFEGGFDADLLDNRISLIVTGYRKTTNDALLSTPVPPSIGIGSLVRNIGTTRNTGLDATVGAQLVRSGPVTWHADLNLSHRRDEVVKLGPGVEPFYVTSSGVGGGQRVAPGYPLFGYWAKPVVGYADLNGDGAISSGEIVLGDTNVYRGAPLPDYSVTLSSSVGLWHSAVVLTADLLYDNGLTQDMRRQDFRDVGLSAGFNDPQASAATQAIAASARLTDFYAYQTVATTRLNALTVTYNVPTSLARRVGAERLSLSLQGQNLGLWTGYRGVDPNVNGYASGNGQVDTGQLPQPRTWQVRINATY